MEKDMLDHNKIGIIGAGNMGSAIFKGLVKKNILQEKQILLSNSSSHNLKVAMDADIIILAVKPQTMHFVLTQISKVLSSNKLFISIAAGIPIKNIQSFI